MCQSKKDGGRRCAKHGGGVRRLLPTEPPKRSQSVTSVPDMPGWYEPERGRASRLLMPRLSDADRRLFWYREQGYKGPINQDGWPVDKDWAERQYQTARRRWLGLS